MTPPCGYPWANASCTSAIAASRSPSTAWIRPRHIVCLPYRYRRLIACSVRSKAERFIALALARHHDAEKAQEGQMIGLVTRDGGHPAHAGGVACVNPLRREALEQAPCGVGLSGDVVRERETEPVRHRARLCGGPAFQPA